jgi:hypothetical protein
MALILLIASILQGEAGPMGNGAMYAVADTMLYRYQETQSWDDVLRYYYGRDDPSPSAISIATQMVTRPWNPILNCRYVYSERDRIRMGWDKGKYIYTVHPYILHFSDTIP